MTKYIVSFEEEFVWGIEESGFVVMNETGFKKFKEKIQEKKNLPDFFFSPRGLVGDDKETIHLLKEYSKKFLEKAEDIVREISEPNWLTLKEVFKLPDFPDFGETNYVSWGYDLFFKKINS